MRRWIAVLTALVLVAALVVGGLLWWRSQPSGDFERAIALAPAEAERVTFTDWGGIREELGADLNADSSADRVLDFLADGYETDLTATSALLSSAEGLQENYGFSPASLEWELFSQSALGAVVVMALPESTDLDGLADRFAQLGYTEPADDDGVWVGGPALMPTIAPTLTPELQHLAIDADERLVLTSDSEDYLNKVIDELGESDGPTELGDVVETTGQPLSAAVFSSTYVCSQLAMTAADPNDQAQAQALLEAAGEVNPVTGFAMSMQPDGNVRVVLSFENDDQARTNADSRAALARGPAPGQGGDFSDRFTVDEVTADGSVVTMELDPVEGQYVLSDLSSGPVLFATC